ncbi:MAG: S8 family serine peptidase [Phycisphaerae bacterium]
MLPRPIAFFVSALLVAGALASPSGTLNAERRTAWVFFHDKGVHTKAARDFAFKQLASTYNPRAIERRMLRRTAPGLFDERDLPVAQTYVQGVENTGARVRVESRWLNAVSVQANTAQLDAIAGLPFVKSVEPVKPLRTEEVVTTPVTGRRAKQATGAGSFYGISEDQLSLMNLILLHDAGFTGEGVIVGVLDTGFRTSHRAFTNPDHPLDIVAEWDFVNDDAVTADEPGDPAGQHDHGSLILGTLGSYLPGELVGGAFDASYILCKVEDAADEYNGEEDFFVAGLEFVEANGGDVATSSVVIFVGYDSSDLDGLTTVMTVGVNVATENGLIVCQGAGNEGHDSNPSTQHLVPPADAFDAITVGATTADGLIAAFSSDGPTADGRVKPEVLARGVSVSTISPGNDSAFDSASGTSLATPLAAGAVACLLQAHPDWTVEQMRNFLFKTADYYTEYRTYDADYVLGYGLLDAYRAHNWDCNGNGEFDADDVGNGTSLDLNTNGYPDECDLPADFNGDERVDDGDYRRFVFCLLGPGVSVTRGCLLADADEDGDVDARDVAAVQAAFTD